IEFLQGLVINSQTVIICTCTAQIQFRKAGHGNTSITVEIPWSAPVNHQGDCEVRIVPGPFSSYGQDTGVIVLNAGMGIMIRRDVGPAGLSSNQTVIAAHSATTMACLQDAN